MPHLKNLIVAAINITTEPPHSPERYRELFLAVRGMVPPPLGEIGRHERLMVNFMAEDSNALSGSFARYTYIDPQSPWWDSRNRTALLDEQGRPVPQVRDGIGPNLRAINFIFIMEHHLLVFDTREISPNQFARALNHMFAREEIVYGFGKVNITVVPKSDALNQLLALPRKRTIKVVLTLPNGPDVPETLEGIIKRRYEKMHLSRTEQKFVGQADAEIAPDEEMKAIMSLAASNGYAEVDYIGDAGKIESQSTRDYPLRETHKCYDNEYWPSMKWLADRILGLIRGQNERDANAE